MLLLAAWTALSFPLPARPAPTPAPPPPRAPADPVPWPRDVSRPEDRTEATRAPAGPPRHDLLPGPVGPYPYQGRRSWGSAQISSFLPSDFSGSVPELQRDGRFPRHLILQDLTLGTGNRGFSALEAWAETPTEAEHRLGGRYRDFRNFDLEVGHLSFHGFDRPSDDPVDRVTDSARLRVRKWGSLVLELGGEKSSADLQDVARDRTARWERGFARGTARFEEFDASLAGSVLRYVDLGDTADAWEDARFAVQLDRDITERTHLRGRMQTRERELAETGEATRDLDLALSTRSYDVFSLRGLTWLNEGGYTNRGASFVRTRDEVQAYRLQSRMVWNLADGGGLDLGFRETRRVEERLTRGGIDRLLQVPGTPRAELARFKEEVRPLTNELWAKLTARVRDKVHLYAGLDQTSTAGVARTDWVTVPSPSLDDSNRKAQKAGVVVTPLEGLTLTAELANEERFIPGRGDHGSGQNERVNSSLVAVDVGLLERFELRFDAGQFDILARDPRVARDTAHATSQYGVEASYALTRMLALEGSHRRLDQDGAATGVQQLSGLAVDYGGTGSPATFRLAYTHDTYDDPETPAAGYQARVVTLSAGVDF